MPKSHSQLIWESVQDPLRRIVRDAWQMEMVKEPLQPDKAPTRKEMLKWTTVARKRLIVAVDKYLEEAIKKYGSVS
jgi:hypothetical protein